MVLHTGARKKKRRKFWLWKQLKVARVWSIKLSYTHQVTFFGGSAPFRSCFRDFPRAAAQLFLSSRQNRNSTEKKPLKAHLQRKKIKTRSCEPRPTASDSSRLVCLAVSTVVQSPAVWMKCSLFCFWQLRGGLPPPNGLEHRSEMRMLTHFTLFN